LETVKKKALGRGLSALIDNEDYEPKTTAAAPIESTINEIELDNISTNPFQPRNRFDEQSLDELAASIKTLGIIQPITVRKQPNGKYQLISGERRFRASRLAGLTKIPAFIRETDDQGMLEVALVENIQRDDLNPIEISISYQRLIEECTLTQDQLSERVGKNRSTISNYIRLLRLPAEVQVGLRDNRISMGHARALINIEDPRLLLKTYFTVVSKDLSVRKTEEMVKAVNSPELQVEADNAGTNQPDSYNQLQEHLSRFFDSKIDFSRSKNGRGKITIPFKSDDELEKIIAVFDKLNV